jgi:hypothetical protein
MPTVEQPAELVEVRALTVQQPWAWAISVADVDPEAKLVENRGRGTSYRGPLAIHAGRRWSDRGQYDDRIICAAMRAKDRGAVEWASDVLFARKHVFGAVIAIVDLVDTHPAAGCCKPWGDDEYPGVERPVHWVLENVRRVDPPIEAPGRLGLWRVQVPAELVA